MSRMAELWQEQKEQENLSGLDEFEYNEWFKTHPEETKIERKVPEIKDGEDPF